MASFIKAEHINPFIGATIETFSSMVRTAIKPGKISLASQRTMPFDASGIIGISGGAKGSVSLSFPKNSALKIVSAFAGEEVKSLDSLVVDAIGELANIIVGYAKKDLIQYKINISLPTVVIGENHQLQGSREVTPILVPFDSDLGAFSLVVSFTSAI